jgi:FkbM family methyltransferase
VNRNDVNLKKLKDKRVSGETPREDYWLVVREILSKFQGLIAIQSERITFIGMQNGQFVVEYSPDGSHQFRMLIDSTDLRSPPITLIADGSYEEFECNLLLKIAKLSSGFCDIGANIGFYTLAAASVNPQLMIFSFEPNPNVGSLFLKNLAINAKALSTGNISFYNYALGNDSDSAMELFVPTITGSGGGSFVNQHPNEGTTLIPDIQVEKLNIFLGNSALIDLIKIDVEGFEFEVIMGGIELIEKMKPTIFIELLRKWMKPFGKQPQDVVTLLKSIGYECYAISSNCLTRIEIISDATVENNFIFVHPERINHLSLITERK